MKKILSRFVAVFLASVLLLNTAFAATAPTFFKPSGTHGLVPTTKYNELGTLSTPWQAIYVLIFNAIKVVYAPSADQSQANDSAVSCDKTMMRVVGSGGAVVLDTNPAIADGSDDGQVCIIEGTSDANTVKIVDGNNVELSASVDFTIGKGDVLTVIWDSGDSTWYEQNRSAN